MARVVNTLYYVDEELNKARRVELIEVNHLRWELVFYDKHSSGAYEFAKVETYGDDRQAREAFKKYLDKRVLVEVANKGRTIKVVRKHWEEDRYDIYVITGNSYTDLIPTQQDLSPNSVIRYLGNALEDGT